MQKNKKRYQVMDMKMASVTDSKKNLSKYLKEVNETNEPIFIMNHNKPDGVLLSNDTYTHLVEMVEEYHFYKRVSRNINEDDGTRYSNDEVINTVNEESNPFSEMTDEELFD